MFDPDIGKSTRWKKGQRSPNPGWAAQVPLLSEALRTRLAELKPGDPAGRTFAEVVAQDLVEIACSEGPGAVHAASEIADRLEGRSRQSVEFADITAELRNKSDEELLFRSALGMLVPIYQGGSLRAQIKIATAQQEEAIAYFGSVALRSLAEVEVALTNEELLAERIPSMESALRDHNEAVRVGRLRYAAGAMDFLSVLQLQEGQITSQLDLIKVRNAQLANRISLHLALGDSFDSSPAASYREATSRN